MFEIGAAISGLGSIISSACSFVGSAVSSLGSSICGMARATLNFLKTQIPNIEGIINCFKSVGDFFGNILNNIFDFDMEKDPMELGMKAMKSEKSLDDFDSDMKKYLKYLKDDIELDEKEIENMSDEKKLGCTSIGTALETKALSEQIGNFEISPKSIYAIYKMINTSNISENTFVELLKGINKIGISSFDDVTDYLEGKNNENNLKTYNELLKILGEDADEKIFELKRGLRNE